MESPDITIGQVIRIPSDQIATVSFGQNLRREHPTGFALTVRKTYRGSLTPAASKPGFLTAVLNTPQISGHRHHPAVFPVRKLLRRGTTSGK